MTTPAEAPEAPVIGADARSVYVRCPYCHGRHAHPRRNMTRGLRTRRAPGCGIIARQDDRITGYWITPPTEDKAP